MYFLDPVQACVVLFVVTDLRNLALVSVRGIWSLSSAVDANKCAFICGPSEGLGAGDVLVAQLALLQGCLCGLPC